MNATTSSEPWMTGENLNVEQQFNRLTFVLCQLAQSLMRVEGQLDIVNDRLGCIEALAQQRNDWIRKERTL
jgi:hypothetical protein